MAKDGSGVSDAMGHMKDALAESGQAVAAQASDIKDQAMGAARTASGKVSEAAHTASGRVSDAAHTFSEQVPGSAQEWETLAKEVSDSIRKNPKPWLIGAAVGAVMFILGRRTAR